MKKETKSKILDFVLSFLNKHDVEKMNFLLISKATGISRTTIYSCYSHTQELFEDILDFYIMPFEAKVKECMKSIHDVYSCYSSCKQILEYVYRNRSFFLVEGKIKLRTTNAGFTDDIKQRLMKKCNNRTKKEFIEQYYFMGLADIYDSWKKADFDYNNLDGCARAMTFYAYSLLNEK